MSANILVVPDVGIFAIKGDQMKLTDEMIRIKARENGASYGKKAELDFGAGAEWARDYYEKENSNVAEPNRYNVLAEVRALLSVIDEEKRNWLNGEPENFLKVVKQAEKVSEHFS